MKMNNSFKKDLEIIRPLAERYSEIAHYSVQQERLDRYADTTGLRPCRPLVLIHEVPWGEIDDKALKNRCSTDACIGFESMIRRALYQWEHFQADMVIVPEIRIRKKIQSSGIGIEVKEKQIAFASGSYAAAHEYEDQLKNEEDLEKLHLPRISYDKEASERNAALAEEIFKDLLPVKICGNDFLYSIWDQISTCRGVEPLLMDLANRPEFMHKTVAKFAEIGRSLIEQYEKLNLFNTDPLLLHCTPAYTRELPAPDFSGKARQQDVWGRCHAQIFSAVSPEMHDEFDLAYNSELFKDFGLVYYGCCEPLDRKIDLLRKRFSNLRKISITPWADPQSSAEQIGPDYVLSAKPNPAFVNAPVFDPAPVEKELSSYLEACRQHGCVCEFILKDISTIAQKPENLSLWAETAEKVIDRYY
jgi:hypothetical protein